MKSARSRSKQPEPLLKPSEIPHYHLEFRVSEF